MRVLLDDLPLKVDKKVLEIKRDGRGWGWDNHNLAKERIKARVERLQPGREATKQGKIKQLGLLVLGGWLKFCNQVKKSHNFMTWKNKTSIQRYMVHYTSSTEKS